MLKHRATAGDISGITTDQKVSGSTPDGCTSFSIRFAKKCTQFDANANLSSASRIMEFPTHAKAAGAKRRQRLCATEAKTFRLRQRAFRSGSV